MCFSPEADIVAGVVIGALAVDVIRHHPARRDLPLALFPVLLAAHSLIEAVVWFAGRGQVNQAIGDGATDAYLAIAFVVIPTYLPFAVRARETLSARRNALTVLLMIGLAVSSTLLWATVDGPITVTLEDHFIQYGVGVPFPGLVVAAYVLATCGAPLLSSSREVVVFGRLNLGAVMILAMLNVGAMTSLWCGWAAVTSLAIVLMVRLNEGDNPPATRTRVPSGLAPQE